MEPCFRTGVLMRLRFVFRRIVMPYAVSFGQVLRLHLPIARCELLPRQLAACSRHSRRRIIQYVRLKVLESIAALLLHPTMVSSSTDLSVSMRNTGIAMFILPDVREICSERSLG